MVLRKSVRMVVPVVLGDMPIVPAGLLAALSGTPLPWTRAAVDTQAAVARARDIVMEIERGLGFEPTDARRKSLITTSKAAYPALGACASSR